MGSAPPLYDNGFYALQDNWSVQSACVVVPLVMEIVRPTSVLDVGCGTGTWLAAFAKAGVTDYLGMDGEYVDRDRLRVPTERFLPVNLEKTPDAGRRFDLVTCLEVAEHLPATVAQPLVAMLTAAAPAILFSAAVPGQGGLHHINEQWPVYWQQRFETQGYVCLDIIRKQIWQNTKIEPYYQQNLFLYVDPNRHQELIDRYPEGRNQQLTLVQSYILERLEEKTKSFWQKVRRLFEKP